MQCHRKNKERINQECYKNIDGIKVEKTKTKSILNKLNNPLYKRGPEPGIRELSKNETKILIMARYGMLECGKNYGNSIDKNCNTCNCLDDENHRLNMCVRWKRCNLYENSTKVDFNKINSNEICVLKEIIPVLEKVWNTKHGHGTMNI